MRTALRSLVARDIRSPVRRALEVPERQPLQVREEVVAQVVLDVARRADHDAPHQEAELRGLERPYAHLSGRGRRVRGARLSLASPASRPVLRRQSNRATGETYHVEIQGGFWYPSPELTLAVDFLDVVGTEFDLRNDLGIEKARFGDLRLVLRPARKHKFRLSYIPIKYEAESVLRRDIIFSGVRYPVGLPVNTTFDWKAWRVGYEYDFIYRDRGFLGLIVEAKWTDVDASSRARWPPRSPPSGPHPGPRSHRASLRRPERCPDRRVHRVPPAGRPLRGRHGGQLLRLRRVRHAELHRQRGRVGRVPLDQCDLPEGRRTSATSRCAGRTWPDRAILNVACRRG
jgi:hypothetical protein